MRNIECNLCNNKEEEFLFEKNGYRIVKCRNCGLIYVNPQPEESELINFYQNYSVYKTRYPRKEKSKLRDARREIKRIRRILPYKKGVRLLDIGCGCGFLLKVAQENGWDAFGVDICKWEVEYGIKKFGVKAIVGDFLDINFNKKFDVITMFDLIEHLSNPFEGLRKTYSLLKEKGILVIETPDIESPEVKKERMNCGYFNPPEHLFYFSLKTLKEMCKKAGFNYKGSFFRFPWREGIKAVFQKK